MGTYTRQFDQLSTTSDLALLFTLESERLHQPSQVDQFAKDETFPVSQAHPEGRKNRNGEAIDVYPTDEALEWFRHRESARQRKAEERARKEAQAATTAQERAAKARERAQKALERARQIEAKYGIDSENGTPDVSEDAPADEPVSENA